METYNSFPLLFDGTIVTRRSRSDFNLLLEKVSDDAKPAVRIQEHWMDVQVISRLVFVGWANYAEYRPDGLAVTGGGQVLMREFIDEDSSHSRVVGLVGRIENNDCDVKVIILDDDEDGSIATIGEENIKEFIEASLRN